MLNLILSLYIAYPAFNYTMKKHQITYQKINDLFKLKLKFAGSSTIATAVDYCLYQLLVYYNFMPAKANLISAGTGLLINFVLQKKYIFNLNRKLKTAFLISFVSSLFGLTISTLFIHYLSKFQFFSTNQLITKALVTAIIFFYNFYIKRFAFEKKIL